MKQLLVLRGLPASGKTTYAKKLVRENFGKFKRVNKDDLRAMIDDGLHSKDAEDLVLRTRDRFILQALADGYNVVVDDTNIEQKHIRALAELVRNRAAFAVKEFDTSVEECIKRDSIRGEKSVGADVIRAMSKRFNALDPDVNPTVNTYQAPSGTPTAIICDLDGTLAKLNGRSPYDASQCFSDDLNRAVYELAFNSGHKVILMSGRDSEFRVHTEMWLDEKIPDWKKRVIGLYMRSEGDTRKDSIIKQELFDNNIRDKYDIVAVFDDRQQVIRMWRANGLPVFDCGPGTEF